MLATGVLFFAGAWVICRQVSASKRFRLAAAMLYISDWFILPKFEICGWIGLALLAALASREERAEAPDKSLHQTLVPKTAQA
jgi:hypothetical protein